MYRLVFLLFVEHFLVEVLDMVMNLLVCGEGSGCCCGRERGEESLRTLERGTIGSEHAEGAFVIVYHMKFHGFFGV